MASIFVNGEEHYTTDHDNVNHPSHYTFGGIELIDVWEATMSNEALQGLYKGNVMKYLWRYEHKNGLEDLRKAEFYLKRLIAAVEKGELVSEDH